MTTPVAPTPVAEFPMDLLDNLDPSAAPPLVDGDEGDDSGDASGDAGAADAGAEGADGGAGAGDGSAGTPGGEGGDDSGGAEGDGAAANAGRPRNSDGTFKSKEQLAAEALAAPPAAKPEAKKVGDPVNDPIPAGLKPATAERMTKLVETVKTVTTRAETAEQERDLLLSSVADTGMNGEEFGEFLGVVKDARSGDPAAQRRAFEYLQSVCNSLAPELGIVPPGVDPLTGHADLIQRVNAATLTRKDAEDIAAARRATQAEEQRRTRSTQQTQQTAAQQAALQQAVQTGKSDLQEMETTLAGADPQFAAKKAAILADKPFIATLKAAHPSTWASSFAKKYRETKVAVAAAPPNGARPGNTPQPLRAKSPAGGGSQVTAPKSMGDAINAIDFSKI